MHYTATPVVLCRMGAGSSTEADSYNNTVQRMDQECKDTIDIVQSNSCNIITNDCSRVVINCDNTATTKQACKLSQTSSIAQSAISNSISVADAGAWGFAFSSATSVASNVFQNVMTQSCANEVNIIQSTNNTYVCNNSDDITFNFLNNYSGSQVCYAQQTSKISQRSAATASATATSWDPTAVLIAICVVGGAIILGLMALDGWIFHSAFGAGGGGSNSTSVNLGDSTPTGSGKKGSKKPKAPKAPKGKKGK